MTATLFLLRCVAVGIAISALDFLTVGVVLTIWAEKANDA